MAQDQTEDVRPTGFAIDIQAAGAAAVVHLHFISRSDLHPAKWQFLLGRQPVDVPANRTVSPREAMLGTKVLKNPLGRQPQFQFLKDGFLELAAKTS
jgi:hypothetical protein